MKEEWKMSLCISVGKFFPLIFSQSAFSITNPHTVHIEYYCDLLSLSLSLAPNFFLSFRFHNFLRCCCCEKKARELISGMKAHSVECLAHGMKRERKRENVS